MTAAAAKKSSESVPEAAEEARSASDDAATVEGQAYCVEFARGRIARGCTPADVLGEFGVDARAWPAGATERAMSEVELGAFIFDWVATSREREMAAEAFARAEYVAVTPAFADCTGRYVDVHFS